MAGTLSVETIQSWLTAHSWVFQAVPGRNVIRMRVRGERCSYDVVVALHEDIDVLSFSTMYPFTVPEPKRRAVAELVVRASDGMNLGGMQFDYDRGRVKFYLGVPVNGGGLGEPQFMRSLYLGIQMGERYFPAFQRVLYTAVSPKTAVGDIEHPESRAD